MPRQIKAVRTKLTIPGLWEAYLLEYESTGREPSRNAINLLVAHACIETGLRSCYCWNATNKRPRTDKRTGAFLDDWCEYPCGEELPEATALKLAASPYVKVVKTYTKAGVKMVSMHFDPPHPFSRFRAFATLRDSARAMCDYLRTHPKTLAPLAQGAPYAYASVLHDYGYYTADENRYGTGLARELNAVQTLTSMYDWGDVL